MSTLWKIGGEAGFGIMTTGLTFSKIASRSGYHIFDYVEYPSLIRGGHNAIDVVFSKDPVHTLKEEIDILVCLNKQTYTYHNDKLAENALVMYDPEEFEPDKKGIKISVPFKKILKELQGAMIMKNTIALGATLALIEGDMEMLYSILSKQFAKKGEKVVEFNKQFAKQGHDHVFTNHKEHIKPFLKKTETIEPQVVLTGNDAFAFGAIASNCRFYSAYPMTPSSSVLATLASWQKKTGIVVRHAEDEIAVINSALGASFAGVRSAVGTSGGGFALMVEAVSFAGIAEIPIVIFLSQRPGPATGMPTWTEQGDLLFAVHAGHGEFPKIVLTPGTMEEMVELTLKAFNLADTYQTPVIVMSDMFLSESHKSVQKSFMKTLLSENPVDRGKIVKTSTKEKYLRYQLSDDGISELLIPGQKGQTYQANSYEHGEDGLTSEDHVSRVQQVNKRNAKRKTYLKNHFKAPEQIGDIDGAEIIFVCWGSTKGSILESMNNLTKKNVKTAVIHFTHVFPLDESIKVLFKEGKRYVIVESNSQAQFARLLRQETGVAISEAILKYDGRPLLPSDIEHAVLHNSFISLK